MKQEMRYKKIRANLQPERPIRSTEFLRGRTNDLENTVRELSHFDGIPFIFGHRGVGKTSLGRTAAQISTNSDREHIYVACAPDSTMLGVFREIAEGMLALAIQFGMKTQVRKKLEVSLSMNPHIKWTTESSMPSIDELSDINVAIRALKAIDDILPNARETVVVLDELEELSLDDRNALAFLIKQIGDQEFSTRFVLIGIAENVHELIGTHRSVPRYITEVPLDPLTPQDLMDIVSNAADAIDVNVPREILIRIAIIGNGFPYYAHLIGKTILIEAVSSQVDEIDSDVYRKGVANAITQSLQELKICYEAATQRGQDYFKHMVWALADFDLVDVRIDDWESRYYELCRKLLWDETTQNKFKNASSNMRKENYGEIIKMTPAKYGSGEIRYRYRRFSDPLMKGYVRLQAESEGVQLGKRELL